MDTFLSETNTWDSIAVAYDQLNRPVLEVFARSALERVQLDADWRVLDIACGPGTSTMLVSEFVDHVDALDFSAEMVRKLKSHIKTEQIDNIFPLQGDAHSLPYSENTMDLCISTFGLIFCVDRKKALREVLKVLKPGGRLLMTSWAPIENSPMSQVVASAIDGGQPSPENSVPLPMSDKDQFKAELEGAGFQNVIVQPVRHEFPVGNIDRFWETLYKAVPGVYFLRSQSDAKTWADIEARALKYLKENLDEGSSLAMEANVAIAQKP